MTQNLDRDEFEQQQIECTQKQQMVLSLAVVRVLRNRIVVGGPAKTAEEVPAPIPAHTNSCKHYKDCVECKNLKKSVVKVLNEYEKLRN